MWGQSLCVCVSRESGEVASPTNSPVSLRVVAATLRFPISGPFFQRARYWSGGRRRSVWQQSIFPCIGSPLFGLLLLVARSRPDVLCVSYSSQAPHPIY